MGGVVVNGLGVHRAYDADIVRYPRNMLKDFADMLTRLTVAVKLEIGSAASQFLALQLSNGLPLGEAVWHGLPIPFGKYRLVVEAFQMRGPTSHVEKYYAFGLGG